MRVPRQKIENLDKIRMRPWNHDFWLGAAPESYFPFAHITLYCKFPVHLKIKYTDICIHLIRYIYAVMRCGLHFSVGFFALPSFVLLLID